jgi:hypothetical protein
MTWLLIWRRCALDSKRRDAFEARIERWKREWDGESGAQINRSLAYAVLVGGLVLLK